MPPVKYEYGSVSGIPYKKFKQKKIWPNIRINIRFLHSTWKILSNWDIPKVIRIFKTISYSYKEWYIALGEEYILDMRFGLEGRNKNSSLWE